MYRTESDFSRQLGFFFVSSVSKHEYLILIILIIAGSLLPLNIQMERAT